ncbi:MAG: MlaA family lipoprotein [Enterobacteriaceae bacterium]|nr:MlaA family lipoprotein [Enterobacteriaceae bacterium]
MKLLSIFFIVFVFFLSGCKTLSFYCVDDFEFFNRRIYSFNRGIDKTLIDPATVVYINIIPVFLEKNISNFFKNFSDFQNFTNSLFVFNFNVASVSLSRIFINSTFGLFGFFDLASRVGIEYFRFDFKEVLRFYGYNNSAYMILPIIGPGTVRDNISLIIMQLFVPQFYYFKRLVFYYFFEILYKKSQVSFDSDFFDKNMVDGYSFLKSIYFQNSDYVNNVNGDDFLRDSME